MDQSYFLGLNANAFMVSLWGSDQLKAEVAHTLDDMAEWFNKVRFCQEESF